LEDEKVITTSISYTKKNETMHLLH